MIGRLRGTLIAKRPPWVLVEVGGVGYELEVPMSTLYDLPDTGKEVILLTHYAHKEETVALYGFLTAAERELFRDVQRVSGIGARIALAILSGVSTAEFARLVQAGDVVALTKIPGIGKKTAERIVVELRDRIGHATLAAQPGAAPVPRDARGEAEAALQQLGYKPAEAARLAAASAEEGDGAEAIIRKALRAALGR
ncbi:MAG: Holliday junction branch migration protein RuvA [Rhodanobacteraceae bacterium]|nr:MAG: Holliday junction branch migration protein RuvA [Rhodanobacteraceae bacterium]